MNRQGLNDSKFLKWGVSLLLAFVGLLTGIEPTWAQRTEVTWAVEAAPTVVQPTETITLRFEATISADWKLYAMDSPAGKPLEIHFESVPDGFTQDGAFRQTGPLEGYDPNFEADVYYFLDKAEVEADFAVAENVQPGPYKIEGRMAYMYCSDTICIPSYASFSVDVDVAAVAASPVRTGTDEQNDSEPALPVTSDPESETQATATPIEEGTGDLTEPELEEVQPLIQDVPLVEAPAVRATDALEQARAGGLWAFILLAIGAGLAALLTPCVFPMIPLTISFFTHQSRSRAQAARMALVYGLAIIITFTGLGVVMALLVGATGAQSIAANPWINLFIGAVFIVFALSLLGLFELRLPHRFVNYVNRQGNQRQGWLGVLFMGFTLTLVSFSCTAPFVGGLLAATADNEFTWPVLGMVAFSTTFALPFIFFAMFPGWLSSLPSSGSWMNVVKVTLGFVELAAAFKFLSNADLIWEWGLISRTLVVALWIVIFFLTGVYLLGKLHLAHDEPVEKIGALRLVCAMGFLGFALYLIPGLLGAPLNNVDAYLPPRQATDVSLIAALPRANTTGSDAHENLNWYSSDTMPYQEAMDQAFVEARATQKPVFIDFTGYTCTNCRHMESTVFARPEVIERFRDNFVLLQLYTDDRSAGAALSKYQLQLTGTAALPTYVVTNPDGELLTRWEGVASVEDFIAFLDQGRFQYQQDNLASASAE